MTTTQNTTLKAEVNAVSKEDFQKATQYKILRGHLVGTAVHLKTLKGELIAIQDGGKYFLPKWESSGRAAGFWKHYDRAEVWHRAADSAFNRLNEAKAMAEWLKPSEAKTLFQQAIPRLRNRFLWMRDRAFKYDFKQRPWMYGQNAAKLAMKEAR